jgi:nucleoside-diphosphate-sugar epimerase
MRTVVIGATGHIGTWLVPRLVRSGHDVVALSRGHREPYQQFAEFRDVRQVTIDREAAERDGSFGRTIADLGADAVIDLICFDLASASLLVDALRGRIAHFIHCGTLWVHGDPPVRPYDESQPREPFGEYGIRKAEIESYLLDAARGGFPATVLHPGHITGPGWAPINPAGHLQQDVFDRLARGERLTLPEDGGATLQHVHADDVAQAFQLVIDHRDVSVGEAFHVAAREPVTMTNYAHEVASWYGREPVLDFAPFDVWKKAVSARDAEITLDHLRHSPAASIRKAEQLLGFSPRFTCTEAVRDAFSAV